jgi:hypothetical protein
LELAVERFSYGQSPLRIHRPPCPTHTPNNTPRAALAIPSLVSSSTLAERPLAVSTDHTHRIPPPRIITTAGNSFPSRTARSVLRPIHWVPASQRTYHVCVSASRLHQHRRMWVAARRTRCRCRGRRAQRGHQHTARSQGSVRAPPAPHRAFSLAHVERTPRADASLRAARHFARVKGRATCVYTAQQLTRAAHQP